MTGLIENWVESARLVREEYRDQIGPEKYAEHTAAFESILHQWRDDGFDVDDPAMRHGMMAGLTYAMASSFRAHEGDKTPWAILTQVGDALARVADMDGADR